MAPLGITADDLRRQTRGVDSLIGGAKQEFNALLLDPRASGLAWGLSEMLESISADFQAWRQAMKEEYGWHLIETTEDQTLVTNFQQGITNMRESIEELKDQIKVVMDALEQQNDTTYANSHTLILHSRVGRVLLTFGVVLSFAARFVLHQQQRKAGDEENLQELRTEISRLLTRLPTNRTTMSEYLHRYFRGTAGQT